MPFDNSFTTTLKLNELSYDLNKQENQVDSIEWKLKDTERQLGRTMLAVEALFEILCERGLVASEEVVARMAEIDLRDGKEDGKIGPVVLECESCKRPVSSKAAKCMYCGEDRPPNPGITSG